MIEKLVEAKENKLQEAINTLDLAVKTLGDVSALIRELAKIQPDAVRVARNIEHVLREPFLLNLDDLAKTLLDDFAEIKDELLVTRGSLTYTRTGVPELCVQVSGDILKIHLNECLDEQALLAWMKRGVTLELLKQPTPPPMSTARFFKE